MTVSPNRVYRCTKTFISQRAFLNTVCVLFIFDDYSEAFLLHNNLVYQLVLSIIAIMMHVTISMCFVYIYERET